MAAERDLATATAAAGVAEAALYPSLSLGGTISAGTTHGWSAGPSLSLPILNRQTLQSDRDQALSLARQAELAWRNTVLTAVEQVHNAHLVIVYREDVDKVTHSCHSEYSYT